MNARFFRNVCVIAMVTVSVICAAGEAAGAMLDDTPATVTTANDQARLEAAARSFVSSWSKGEYENASTTFDETMRTLMPPEKMQEAWETLVARVGRFEEQVGTRTEISDQHVIVFVTCRFEASPIDIKVVYDRQHSIAGLWFVPTAYPVDQYEPPPYADRDAFTEEEVRIGAGEWELPGTLSLPNTNGPFPAVVLVHGSGPNDRDETIGPNKPFRDLAWGLATNGIAVLRYDKRTKVYGAKIAALESGITVREETVDDALAAVRLLRGDTRIDGDRIFVLGHSLGGYCVPMIGKGDTAIAGFIIMAGATRPLEDLLLEQYTYIFSLDGTISDTERTELDKIETQVAAVKDPGLSPGTPRASLPLGVNAEYWLDLRAYRPTILARELDRPFLVLHAARDYQVTAVDFENWKTALSDHRDAAFKSYPSLNHLFIAGEGTSSPDEYRRAGHVAVTAVTDISQWIALH